MVEMNVSKKRSFWYVLLPELIALGLFILLNEYRYSFTNYLKLDYIII
jgi:ABC-type sugar transport system permease subunit